jgi:hypothetical protein
MMTKGRPGEGGRTALVRWTHDGGKVDAPPPEFDVGSRVHEYGGNAYFAAGGVLLVSNLTHGRVYRAARGRAADAHHPGSSRARLGTLLISEMGGVLRAAEQL